MTSDCRHQRRPLPLRLLPWSSVAALAACTTAGADDGANGGPVESPRGDRRPRCPQDRAFDSHSSRSSSRPSRARLTKVTVTDERDRKVIGKYRHRHRCGGRPRPPLPFDTRYQVQAKAEDSDGVATKTSTWLHTVKPKRTAYTGITPYGGGRRGGRHADHHDVRPAGEAQAGR